MERAGLASEAGLRSAASPSEKVRPAGQIPHRRLSPSASRPKMGKHIKLRAQDEGEIRLRSEWEEAVLRGCVDELQRLVDCGIDINARNQKGQTTLMLAAAEGQAPVVTWLVTRGAALDQKAKYGLSALMLAVVRGHADVVRELAHAGANVSLRGTGPPGFSGKTALDLAVARGDLEMIEILRSAAAAGGRR